MEMYTFIPLLFLSSNTAKIFQHWRINVYLAVHAVSFLNLFFMQNNYMCLHSVRNSSNGDAFTHPTAFVQT